MIEVYESYAMFKSIFFYWFIVYRYGPTTALPLLPSSKSDNAWKKIGYSFDWFNYSGKPGKARQAQDAALELDSGEIAANDSMKIIIEGLNKNLWKR